MDLSSPFQPSSETLETPASLRLALRSRRAAAGAAACEFPGGTSTKPQENHRKTMRKWWFYGISWDLPSGNECCIAIDNGHRNSGFTNRTW